jgi:hypothetical protein
VQVPGGDLDQAGARAEGDHIPPGDATLKFRVITGIAAIIGTMPLEHASEAYARIIAGDARFRVAFTMKPDPESGAPPPAVLYCSLALPADRAIDIREGQQAAGSRTAPPNVGGLLNDLLQRS